MQVKPLPPDDLSCPPPPDAEPRPEVRLRMAHGEDLRQAQGLLAVCRELTSVAHGLADPDPNSRYCGASRLALQARLMEARLALSHVIRSLTPSE